MNIPALNQFQIAALIVGAIAAVIDYRTTKIPNWLTFGSSILALGAQFYFYQVEGLVCAVIGWFLGAIIMIFPHPKKKIAFGDAKLMAALGALLGPADILIIFFYFCLCWGFVSIGKLLRVLPIFGIIQSAFFGQGVASAQVAMQTQAARETLKTPIALGPVIFTALLLAIFLKQQTLQFFGFAPQH
jgi:Flp pilus assembly protein protease CpaA